MKQFWLAAILIFSTGCSDFESDTYRILAVTQADYQAIQQHTAEAVAHGLLTPDQWLRFQVEAHVFTAAHDATVETFQGWAHARNKQNRAILLAMLEQLPILLGDVKALVRGFEREPSQPSIIPSEETLPRTIFNFADPGIMAPVNGNPCRHLTQPGCESGYLTTQ